MTDHPLIAWSQSKADLLVAGQTFMFANQSQAVMPVLPKNLKTEKSVKKSRTTTTGGLISRLHYQFEAFMAAKFGSVGYLITIEPILFDRGRFFQHSHRAALRAR